MKQRKISVPGNINSNGELKMFMGELRQFFANWKDSRIIATFEVVPTGQSEALKAYYYNYVVPTMKQAFWDNGTRMTDAECEVYLREMSPIMAEEHYVNGHYQVKLKEIDEISNEELIEHIDTIKQMAAEDYSVYIEDPK